jgi:hypothetical protein
MPFPHQRCKRNFRRRVPRESFHKVSATSIIKLMGIRFYCPSCDHKLNVKAFLAGKRGVCPQCGGGLDIPLESQIVKDPGRPTEGGSTSASPQGSPTKFNVPPVPSPSGVVTLSPNENPGTPHLVPPTVPTLGSVRHIGPRVTTSADRTQGSCGRLGATRSHRRTGCSKPANASRSIRIRGSGAHTVARSTNGGRPDRRNP